MEVIKAVNNNVAVCIDSKGNELIAFGKGIGFGKVPFEVDISKINRTFYDINPDYLNIIRDLPTDILEFSAEMIDEVKAKLTYELSPNAFLSLADHICFSIKRAKEGMYIKMPLPIEMKQLYPTEMKLSTKVVDEIYIRFNVDLDKNEVSGIAMNLVNSGIKNKANDISSIERAQDRILEDITCILEDFFSIDINRDSFNYIRFISHLTYLLKRLDLKEVIKSENNELYEEAIKSFKRSSTCVESIEKYLKNKYNFNLTNEEKLYLIMHVNRVCVNEGCNY